MLTWFVVMLSYGFFVLCSLSLLCTVGFAVVLTCWLLLFFLVSLRLSLRSLLPSYLGSPLPIGFRPQQ